MFDQILTLDIPPVPSGRNWESHALIYPRYVTRVLLQKPPETY